MMFTILAKFKIGLCKSFVAVEATKKVFEGKAVVFFLLGKGPAEVIYGLHELCMRAYPFGCLLFLYGKEGKFARLVRLCIKYILQHSSQIYL